MSTETYEVHSRVVKNNGRTVHIAYARGVGSLLAVGDTYREALDALYAIVAWQHVLRSEVEAEHA